MGISRDSRHKRRKSGGKPKFFKKKRKYEMGRQPTNTRLGEKRVRPVRKRGGSIKMRALRLDTGNFSWQTEAISRKARILTVVYNCTNNELVRTNTLVKGCIVAIDAAPFKQWFYSRYGVDITTIQAGAQPTGTQPTGTQPTGTQPTGTQPTADAAVKPEETKAEPVKAKLDLPKGKGKGKKEGKIKVVEPTVKEIKYSENSLKKKRKLFRKNPAVEPAMLSLFQGGKLYAALTSSPGQVGRADGYLLEGEELAFYARKLSEKKKKK